MKSKLVIELNEEDRVELSCELQEIYAYIYGERHNIDAVTYTNWEQLLTKIIDIL